MLNRNKQVLILEVGGAAHRGPQGDRAEATFSTSRGLGYHEIFCIFYDIVLHKEDYIY